MKKSVLRKYANLIVKVGANVQKGQDVIVIANVDQEQLVTYVIEECYKAKANAVEVRWQSDKVAKVIYKKESIKSLSYVPNWKIEREKVSDLPNRQAAVLCFLTGYDIIAALMKLALWNAAI